MYLSGLPVASSRTALRREFKWFNLSCTVCRLRPFLAGFFSLVCIPAFYHRESILSLIQPIIQPVRKFGHLLSREVEPLP